MIYNRKLVVTIQSDESSLSLDFFTFIFFSHFDFISSQAFFRSRLVEAESEESLSESEESLEDSLEESFFFLFFFFFFFFLLSLSESLFFFFFLVTSDSINSLASAARSLDFLDFLAFFSTTSEASSCELVTSAMAAFLGATSLSFSNFFSSSISSSFFPH